MSVKNLVVSGLVRTISVENEADLGVHESLRMILSGALLFAIENRWSW